MYGNTGFPDESSNYIQRPNMPSGMQQVDQSGVGHPGQPNVMIRSLPLPSGGPPQPGVAYGQPQPNRYQYVNPQYGQQPPGAGAMSGMFMPNPRMPPQDPSMSSAGQFPPQGPPTGGHYMMHAGQQPRGPSMMQGPQMVFPGQPPMKSSNAFVQVVHQVLNNCKFDVNNVERINIFPTLLEQLENADNLTPYALCRLGREIIYDVAAKIAELLVALRTICASMSHMGTGTSLDQNARMIPKLQENLKQIIFLMQKLNSVSEKIADAYRQLPQPVLTKADLIPNQDGKLSEAAQNVKKTGLESKVYKETCEQREQLVRECREKREQVGETLNFVRELHRDVDAMISNSKLFSETPIRTNP